MEKFLYLSIFLAIVYIEKESLQSLYYWIKGIKIKRRTLDEYSSLIEDLPSNPVLSYIDRSIKSSNLKKVFPTVNSYLCFWVIISFFGFCLGVIVFNLSQGFLLGIFFGFLPLATLVITNSNRRFKCSMEGDVIASELLNNYRISGKNMKEAVEMTGKSLEEKTFGKEAFLSLAKGLNNCGTRGEILSRLELFKFTFNTNWGRLLATNIFFSAFDGTDVEASLEDLAISLIHSREAIEQGKRNNYEGRLILYYFIPASYLLSILAAIKFFNMTARTFFKYQFMTTTGIHWFSLTALSYLISLCLMKILGESRMDI